MKPRQMIPPVPGANKPLPAVKNNFPVWIMLALLLTLFVARAEAQDDDYLNIYGVIEQADALNASGKTSQAHAKYIEAARALMQLQRDNPNWNKRMISYRLNYLTEKIAATSGQVALPERSTATNDAASVSKSPVTLLDAGSEPRIVLRLHPSVGDTQTVVLTFKAGMTMAMGGSAMPPQDSPEVSLTLNSVVKDVSTNGDCTYQVTLADGSISATTNLPPDMMKEFQSQLAAIRGTTGIARTSSRAINLSLAMNLPPGTDPDTGEILNEVFAIISTALPEEPVGPGAQWDFHYKPKMKDMKFDETVRYTLDSVDGGQIKLHTTFNQNLANQKFDNPMMPGMKMDLSKLAVTGDCAILLDLTKTLPVSAKLHLNIQVAMNMGTPQQRQTMEMTAKLQLGIASN